jgi:CspA family cold shock protein
LVVGVARGTLNNFDASSGYGYITPDDGGAEVFVHADEFGGQGDLPPTGTRLKFSTIPGTHGPKAYNVMILSAGNPARAPDRKPESSESDVLYSSAAAADPNSGSLATVEYADEVIGILSAVFRDVTAAQLATVSSRLVGKAVRRGWVNI